MISNLDRHSCNVVSLFSHIGICTSDFHDFSALRRATPPLFLLSRSCHHSPGPLPPSSSITAHRHRLYPSSPTTTTPPHHITPRYTSGLHSTFAHAQGISILRPTLGVLLYSLSTSHAHCSLLTSKFSPPHTDSVASARAPSPGCARLKNPCVVGRI